MADEHLDMQTLTQLAEKYASKEVLWSNTCDRLIDSLEVTDLQQLARFHRYVISEQLESSISELLQSLEANFRDESVYRLFILLDRLGERGISPFDNPRLSVFHRPVKLDWRKLPAELHYLIPALSKYGVYQYESSVLELLDQITEEEVNELAILAERIRLSDHEKLIDQWLVHFPETEHQESAFVVGLLGVMDFLGLDWQPEITTEWIRSELWNFDWKISKFFSAAEGAARLLPEEEGWMLTVAALRQFPKSRLRLEIHALQCFRSPRALDWIEQNIHDNLPELDELDSWGQVAALSQLSWKRVEKWLRSGRPLSLVAIEALSACWKRYSAPLEEERPTLVDPVSQLEMNKALHDYAKQDPDPYVQEAVEEIINHWAEICP